MLLYLGSRPQSAVRDGWVIGVTTKEVKTSGLNTCAEATRQQTTYATTHPRPHSQQHQIQQPRLTRKTDSARRASRVRAIRAGMEASTNMAPAQEARKTPSECSSAGSVVICAAGRPAAAAAAVRERPDAAMLRRRRGPLAVAAAGCCARRGAPWVDGMAQALQSAPRLLLQPPSAA